MFRLALALFLFSGMGWSESKLLTKQDALRLVRAALPEWALKAGPVYVAPYNVDAFPHFYFFLASRNNPGGSGTVGHFAVHIDTGDVWDGVVCQEYKSEAVVRLQVPIRKKPGITEATYEKLKRQGPFCDELK